jgi:hypothetical protein
MLVPADGALVVRCEAPASRVFKVVCGHREVVELLRLDLA